MKIVKAKSEGLTGCKYCLKTKYKGQRYMYARINFWNIFIELPLVKLGLKKPYSTSRD